MVVLMIFSRLFSVFLLGMPLSVVGAAAALPDSVFSVVVVVAVVVRVTKMMGIDEEAPGTACEEG